MEGCSLVVMGVVAVGVVLALGYPLVAMALIASALLVGVVVLLRDPFTARWQWPSLPRLLGLVLFIAVGGVLLWGLAWWLHERDAFLSPH